MRNQILFIAILLVVNHSIAQKTLAPKDLLNKVVGGVWVSTNGKNSNSPDDFKTFFMLFDNWGDSESATGNIYGITNSGDTTQLLQVWNFVDEANNNIFLVQRDAFGGKSIGSITPYEGKHLDIQFMTTIADGRTYYTRDIHYFENEKEIKTITFHKAKEEDDWEEARKSMWVRKN